MPAAVTRTDNFENAPVCMSYFLLVRLFRTQCKGIPHLVSDYFEFGVKLTGDNTVKYSPLLGLILGRIS